jgi:DNA recombination protein RmuC
VLVSARRLSDLEVTSDDLAGPGVVTDAPRQLSAAELLDAVAEPRPELPRRREASGSDAPAPRHTA